MLTIANGSPCFHAAEIRGKGSPQDHEAIYRPNRAAAMVHFNSHLTSALRVRRPHVCCSDGTEERWVLNLS